MLVWNSKGSSYVIWANGILNMYIMPSAYPHKDGPYRGGTVSKELLNPTVNNNYNAVQ